MNVEEVKNSFASKDSTTSTGRNNDYKFTKMSQVQKGVAFVKLILTNVWSLKMASLFPPIKF